MTVLRFFLKTICVLGAFLLVFTVSPEHVEGIKNMLRLPEIILGVDHNPVPVPKAETTSENTWVKKMVEDIRVLTSPEMEGRRGGTTGETRAALYIMEQLQQLGLEELGENGYFQVFTIPPMEERFIKGRALFRPSTEGLKMPSCNILAGLEGKNKDEKIILSAHFDHLGIFNGQLCPGANDNASGVSCVLEIMRRLKEDQTQGKQPEKSIMAVFWGAEEMGYLGSRHFVDHPTVPLEQIKGVINLDSVANGSANSFIIWTNKNSPLAAKIQKIGQEKNAHIKIQEKHTHFSDEVSFKKTSIPALTILSKEWLTKNHTPEDNLSQINEEKLDLICDIVYQLIYEL